MNVSLKEYKAKTTYGTCAVKRTKPNAEVAKRQGQAMMHTEDYCVILQDTASTYSDSKVLWLSYLGAFRPEHRLMGLGGKWYEEIANFIVGNSEGVAIQVALDDAIEDGRINFDRLANWFSRKESSSKAVHAYKLAVQFLADRELIQSKTISSSRTIIISVVGTLVEKTSKVLTIDWYGGSTLCVPRSRAEGDWDQVQVGDWLELTVARATNGEVVRAMLLGKVPEPEGFSEEELSESYSSIPVANLDPVK